MQRIKTYLFNLILVFFSLFLTFIVLEMYFRWKPFTFPYIIVDSYYNKQRWLDLKKYNELFEYKGVDSFHSLYGWNLIPNLKIDKSKGNHQSIIMTNARGERMLDTIPYSRTNKKRIVVIGDSYTYGEGVNTNQTYCYYIDSLLEDYEVINLGVHGYGTDQILLKLLEEGIKYNPDIVVLGAFDEDLYRSKLWFRDYFKPYCTIEQNNLKFHTSHIVEPNKFLKQPNSVLYNFVNHKIANNILKVHEYFDFNLYWKIIDKMRESCQKSNAKFVILYIPEKGEFEKPSKRISMFWKEYAFKTNTTLINPFQNMIEAIPKYRKPFEYHFEYHYSPEMHYEVAKSFVDNINYLEQK